ncbi:MAG: preprotein translocase subunit YajC [Clostridiales bacterium]|jgi:preprotein translocase subunit YajC|nr:preprotein translocase subunit YajC [Clostridiales bacterium]
MFTFYEAVLGAAAKILAWGTPIALATGAEGAAAADAGAASILPLIGYIAVFGVFAYLVIYRPQKKKEKKARELVDSVQVGNRITTHGGVVGKVINIKDDMVTIETSVERTQVEVKKWAIRDVDKPVEA